MKRIEGLVSVVIPVYNLRDHVIETLNSALNQTYGQIEVLVIDDCSTDGSFELVQQLSDPRLVVLRNEKNSGPGPTRNLGLERARGEFIALLDGDDLWHQTKLEKQIAFMNERGIDACFSKYDLIDEWGVKYMDCEKLPTSGGYHSLLRHCFIRTSAFVFKGHLIDAGVRFPSIKRRQDFVFFLSILKKAQRAHLLDHSLASYRLRQGSVSSGKFGNIRYQWEAFRNQEKLGVLYSVFLMGNWFLRSGTRVLIRRSRGLAH